MTNFIFKSQGTYKKLCQQLVIIQSELRHQRSDNVLILSMLSKLITNKDLERQADDYYAEHEGTSHQTDLEEHDTSSRD